MPKDTPPIPNSLNDAAEHLKARLRTDLRAAMRERVTTEISVLRALIAAIDNAQAAPIGEAHQRYVELRFGDRSAETPRLCLSGADVDALLEREVREKLDAAEQFDRLGQGEHAAALRAHADIVARYRRA